MNRMINELTKKAACVAMVPLFGASMVFGAEFTWNGSGESDVWNTSNVNWLDGSTPAAFVGGTEAIAIFASGGAKDVTVDAAGVSLKNIRVNAGADHVLRGGGISAVNIIANAGILTVFNTIETSDDLGNGLLMEGGSIIVGAGGLLDTAFTPYSNVSTYDSRLTVLTNGTLRTKFHSWFVNDSGYKATLYFDGGTFIHKEDRDQKFNSARFILGAGGLHFQETTASASTWSRLPGPIGTDETLSTDGGIIIDSHEGYMLLPNYTCTYRGGLHLAGTGGHVGLRADGNLGAVPAEPSDNVFFKAAGSSSILVGHQGYDVIVNANRRFRIADGARARIGTYDASAKLTVKGTISSENPENGILQIYPYSQSATSYAGPVTLDPGDGRTNTLGRLWVGQPLVIASGTTRLMNTTDIGVSTADNELYGVNNGSPLNVSGGGKLTVKGGVLCAPAGSRPISQSAKLIVDGGFVDFDGHEILHANTESWMAGGTESVSAVTTVKNGGRLHVEMIRMAGAGNKTSASKSVLNLETGGVVRVKSSLYIHSDQSSYKATVNFNGGTLEWARTHQSWRDSPYGNDNTATRDNIAYKVLAGGMNITNDVEMWFYPAIQSGVAAGETDGGLTKWGSSTFALMSSDNTFNGPLTAMQGTVSLGVSGALPESAVIRVGEEGRFNMNKCAQTVARIEGSGRFVNVENDDGTRLLSVSSAVAPGMGPDSFGTLTLNGGCNIADGVALEIDLDAEGNSDCLSYPKSLDLSKMTLKINDTAKLNRNERYTIAELPSGVTGAFKSMNLERNWIVRYREQTKTLQLSYLNGTVFVFR